MSNSLDILAKHRDALLLAEVAAWLHMFGKLHEEFLYGNHDVDKEIPKSIQYEFPDLYELLIQSWTGCIWKKLDAVVPELKAGELSIFDLIKDHRTSLEKLHEQQASGLLKLMVDAHGRGSGLEKGLLDDFALGQEKRVHPSTSLGYETSSYVNLPTIYVLRQFFYGFLETFLKELKEYIDGRSTTVDELTHVKEWQILRRKFLQYLKQTFQLSVADTRRPFNDITLLDQTLASVAFFKAALAQNLLKGWKEPPHQKEIEGKYHWRLLKVEIDSLTYWRHSVRIGDILARKNLIEDVLDEVQIFLEVKYPLGMEVYRDENGSIFIVPDIEKIHQEYDIEDYVGKKRSLEVYIQDMGYKSFSDETTLKLFLDRSTRNIQSFGELLARTMTQTAPKFDLHRWQNARDICPICGIRPQGPDSKALNRKICNECLSKRVNRSKKWANDLSSTIWLDEVADINGRLALLVAQFDLAPWLSGSLFNTVLTFDPATRYIDKIKCKFDLSELIDNIKVGLISRKNPVIKKGTLLGKLVPDERGSRVETFYKLRTRDSNLENIDASINLSEDEILALEIIRLPPSFARIYRVWQTTKTFWEDIVFDFIKTIGRVSPRLKITFTPGAGLRNTLAITHVYELKLDSVNLSVVYIGNDEFIIVDNLLRTASLLDPSEKSSSNSEKAIKCIMASLPSGKEFEVEEPTSYGTTNRRLGKLYIREVVREETSYTPAVTVLTAPRTFMALVPADRVLSITKAIEAKYQEEITKVRNRLPLKIGIVFADRRTPLPAILDAGQRMLKQPTSKECWIVHEVEKPSSTKEIYLTLEKDTHLLSLKVPTVMGDNTTEDPWYPYWCVEKNAEGSPFSARQRHFKGAEGKEWVHVCDLRKGDVVHFQPSRFDFEWLDTAARRFEISYKDGMRRSSSYPGSSSHPARPYYLEELDDFKKLWQILSRGLANSQIHDLIEFIETKRTIWDAKRDNDIFKHMIRDALNNAYWQSHPTETELDSLEQAALNGQLTDVFELYVRILKNRTEIDKAGGNI